MSVLTPPPTFLSRLARVALIVSASSVAIAGLRTEFSGEYQGNRTEKLFSFSLFQSDREKA